MYTVDELVMRAPTGACFRAAADVERWPKILPHYRRVRFLRRDGFGTGRVEMAAWRDFGPVPWPVWWVSEMGVDESRPAVLYAHVEGITTGMEVEWLFEPLPEGGTRVRIVHDWPPGPAWPLPSAFRRAIGNRLIGPVFIKHVAGRTLRGIRSHVEGVGSDAAPVSPSP